jgi:hypothetical protein
VLAGRHGPARLAALAEKLVDHPDSYASDAATGALGDLVRMGLLDKAGRKGWRRFVHRLYAPLLSRYGFDPRAGAYAADPPERAQRRAQIVGRLVGAGHDRALRARLTKAARAYLGGDTGALDAAWFGPAFAAWLDAGKLPAARRLVDRALASEDPLLRPAALAAAATSGAPDVARWLLALDDARLRPSEQRDLLRGVILTPATRDIGYDWLRAHLDELTSGAGGIFYAARLPQLLSRFCSTDRADAFARELRPRFAGKPGALELERAIERVRDCGVLHDRRGTRISAEFARLK